MSVVGSARAVGQGLAAAAFAVAMAGTAAAVAAPTSAAPTVSAAIEAATPATATPATAATATAPSVPAPSEVVRETGSWFAHGYTLELHSDGTGMFAAWIGAFDGTRIALRLIPAPGTATVAEVTAIESVGSGALDVDEQPGVGGLVTIAFGDAVVPEGQRTAHVEWSSGPRRLAADVCPTEGLDALQMAALRCGA